MPSLSNGHLGYTVFGNAVFMNGVYNGAGGDSRRARIPNWINITAELCNPTGCQISNDSTDISYEMDLRGGYFRYKKNYESLGLTLEQRTYPHRYYNRALIYEVLAYRQTSVALNHGEFEYRNCNWYFWSFKNKLKFYILIYIPRHAVSKAKPTAWQC